MARETYHSNAVKNITDVKTMKLIPSKSICDVWHETLRDGRYKAISCELGTFDNTAVMTLLKLHGLRDIAENVKREKAWLDNTVLPPHENCLPPDADRMKEFESLLFQNTDDKVVLNRTILASDLSVLTVNKWLNLSIIQGFLDIVNEQSTDTKAFILNSLIGLKGDLPEDQLKKCAKKTVRFFTFVICVGGNISETFLGTPYHPGCHWSLLYVDTVTNEWFYCDSLGWAPPKELKNLVDKVISAFSNLIQLPIRPVQGRFIAHMPSNTSHGVHGCSALCLRNIPLQKCGNICGVVAIILAAISCIDKPLWSNSFLKRNACPLPDNISWLRHPTTYASYLRKVLIHWLMAKHIDLRLIGITTPANAAAAPVCPQVTMKNRRYTLNTRRTTPANKKIFCEKRFKNRIMANSHQKVVPSKRKNTTASIKKTLSEKGVKEQLIIDDARNGMWSGKKELTDTNNDILYEQEIKEEINTDNVKHEITSHRKERNDTNNHALCKEKIEEEIYTNNFQNEMTSDRKEARGTINDTMSGKEIKEINADNVQNKTMSDRKEATETKNETLYEQEIKEEINTENIEHDIMSGKKELTGANNDTLYEEEIEEEINTDNVNNDITSDRKETNDTNNHTLCQVNFKKEINTNNFQNKMTSDRNGASGTSNDTMSEKEIKEINANNVQNKTTSDRIEATDTKNETLSEERITKTMKGRDEIKMKVKIINETLNDNYSIETKRGIDTTENIFYVGQRFSSLDELERIKSKYEDDNFCELWKKDVRTLAAAQKRVPKRIAIANPSLYYYSLLLSCKFGGEPKKRKIRVRKTKSFRQGCPFEVYLALALDGQALY